MILLVHLGFRLYRLGDWTTGIHGDEGEAGMDALAILQGRRVSPFANGWYAQSNFYYWGVALGVALFGSGLAGLRAFAAVAGALLILPFYLLVRGWFGVRTALIASTLLAISDVAIHFSRQEFSNITTPLLLTSGAYFFFRGLRSHRLHHFVLAGFSHALGLYFYGGGRLTPLLWGAFLLYLFVAMPLVHLPRTYGRLRRLATTSRRVAIARALRFEARPLRTFSACLAAYLLALVCVASPWVSYYLGHLGEGNARAREKVIFNNQEPMASRHGAVHGPLYLGVQSPFTSEGVRAPLALRRTGAAVRVLKDGFWPRVIWGQLGATLSILTHSLDGSSVYTFTGKPVAKPVEATLILLGMAWALWRWRDTRMACLSIWFWSTVVVGGAMTIDAPYMARLVGIIPAMAVFAAVVLGKLWTEAERAAGAPRAPSAVARGLRLMMPAAVVGLLAFLAWQNFRDYYFRYVGPQAFTAGTGQAIFVRDMNRRLGDEGLVPARYYHLGVHYIYWGYGPNRFLNHATQGADVANVAELLPIVDDESAAAVFMAWPVNQQYLPILEDYYPGGSRGALSLRPPGPARSTSRLLSRAAPGDRRTSPAARLLPASGRTSARASRVWPGHARSAAAGPLLSGGCPLVWRLLRTAVREVSLPAHHR